MMKIVADMDIPFLQGVLEPFADVVYIKGAAIDAVAVSDADALLVRTRTKCNESLLKGSRVKFIASATIGTDHADLDYLQKNNIAFANAPGCNASGVMQYVFTALYQVACRNGISLKNKTLGVIGVGNVGGLVAALGEYLGFRVLRNDPPKEAVCAGGAVYCSLDYLLSHSDIITMHIPLDETTRSMASEEFFSRILPGSVFINASRGEVVDDAVLLNSVDKLSALVLDVWNGEPSNISRELVAAADIATPHIAGYSFEGKVNGTSMVVQALAKHFGISELLNFEPERTITPKISFYDDSGAMLTQQTIADSLLSIFPIYELDKQLRENSGAFEKIRSEYKYRREFTWR